MGRRLLGMIGLLAAGCAGLPTEPPRLSIVNLVRDEATMLEQTYRITLRIQNPNPRQLNVEGLSYSLQLGDRSFLSGVTDQPFTVPQNGEGEIEVVGVGPAAHLMPPVETLDQSPTGPVAYRLAGTLDLAGYQLSDIQTPSLVFSDTGVMPLPPGLATDYGLPR
jgi:LEA14-like dessication related protein